MLQVGAAFTDGDLPLWRDISPQASLHDQGHVEQSLTCGDLSDMLQSIDWSDDSESDETDDEDDEEDKDMEDNESKKLPRRQRYAPRKAHRPTHTTRNDLVSVDTDEYCEESEEMPADVFDQDVAIARHQNDNFSVATTVNSVSDEKVKGIKHVQFENTPEISGDASSLLIKRLRDIRKLRECDPVYRSLARHAMGRWKYCSRLGTENSSMGLKEGKFLKAMRAQAALQASGVAQGKEAEFNVSFPSRRAANQPGEAA